ncbi:hypothetical protein RRG08_035676 [Elysia crispata]|uniref:Uncharacterized protein n=1 Tax=Elysia crispata TaxID=231223 RepID=A0AAE0YAY1_9GAST|nr:hypothetical protein RRG08_035676 [Elysia crispata]
MDGDGELQPGDDVNASLPCASESAERHGGSNMKDAKDTGANDSNNNGGGGGGDDDDGGDGGDDGGGGGGDDDGGGSEEKGDDDDDGEEDEEEEDFEEDDSDEDRMHIDIPEEQEGEGEDDQDSTDGEPPSSLVPPGAVVKSTATSVKRVPVQSQRMRDYQAMQQVVSQSSRPRRCPICGRVLYSGPGFRYHLSTHHAGKESFTCDTCRKKFRSFNGLKYHRKRKRCKGLSMSTADVPEDLAASASSLTTSQTTGAPIQTPFKTSFEEEFHAQRLMELAKIATSPQSPLLQSPGPDSRGSVSGAFFDDPEASAVMTLSSMMRSSESRKSIEACSSSTTQYSSQQHHHQQQQQQPQPQQQHPSQDSKSKRPMNGFMLFAQQHRAELKKKYPNTNNRMISTKLSEEWNNLPDSVRQQWKDEAKIKAEQQLKEHPDCWKRKK